MTFARLLSEALSAERLPATGDVLAVGLPLLRQLDELHRSGMVSRLSGLDHLTYDGNALSYDTDLVQLASVPSNIVNAANPLVQTSGVEVTSRLHVNHGTGTTSEATVVSADVYRPDSAIDLTSVDANGLPARPLFVTGYKAWEQFHDHHDPLTDIHIAGLLLVSYATGLDLTIPDAVNDLAFHHRQLLVLNPRLHPVVAGTLSDMIAPNRHRRPDSVASVIARLEHHRELPSDLNLASAYLVEDNYEGNQPCWEHQVLTTLRERVFDTSRRNRALYFRPTSGALSLTEASVPLLLNSSRIRSEDILTWTGPSAEAFRSGKPVDLGRWCRFEENVYLRPGLERMISTERKLRAEHGQGRLHLIIAFLRWFDPTNEEAVDSPLLIMPAGLIKKKGVSDRFLLDIDQKAEVNPVLRHVLRSRFGIEVADSIDSDAATIASFVAELEEAVQQTAPAVKIELVTRPRISIIQRRAKLRVAAYNRRRTQALATSGRWRRQDHSYDLDDWRPLGQALYARFIRPSDLPLRSLTAAPPPPRSEPRMSEGPQSIDGPPESVDAGERSSKEYHLTTNQVNQQRWEVDLCSVTLASLGSRRSSISRDYDTLLLASDALADGQVAPSSGAATIGKVPPEEADGESIKIQGSPFQHMFSPEPRPSGDSTTPKLDLSQLLVLPADAAQASAVRRGVDGHSFIIQGPPGTGKSQTITNLIAGLVGEGKRVLFVCEKRAALDVVAHRLRQVGLDELVATIHDSQRDRREFISDLGITYEKWLEADESQNNVEDLYETALANTARRLLPIGRLLDDASRLIGGGPTAISVLHRVLELRSCGVEPAATGLDIGLATWTKLRPRLDEIIASLTVAGLSPSLSDHAGLTLQPSSLTALRNYSEVNLSADVARYGGELETAASRFVSAFLAAAMSSNRSDSDALPSLDPSDVPLSWLAQIGAHGPELERLTAIGRLDILDSRSDASMDLRSKAAELANLDSEVAKLEEVRSRWLSPFNPADTSAALQLAVDKEHSALRVFSKRWRHTNKAVRLAYKFSDHQIEPTITSVLTDLDKFHQAAAKAASFRQSLTARFGTDGNNPEVLLDLMDTFRNVPMLTSRRLTRIESTVISNFGAAAADVVEQAQMLGSPIGPSDHQNDPKHVWQGVTVGSLSELARELKSTPIDLETALSIWSGLTEADPAVLARVAASSNSPDEIELAIFEAAIGQMVERTGPRLANSNELTTSVDQLLESYSTLLETNAKLVASRAQARFSDQIAFSESSMAGRSDADKAYKRRYRAGRKILEREFEKKMRFRSIRDLASGDSGLVVRALKPVWLMSPLSVSDTLPLDDSSFDVVIFDEASQIPVEDAIPTMFRSRQVIVVGDRMQLPPTRFFSSSSDDEDEIFVDEDGHRLTLSLDADSFLTQADLALSSTMLTWHYRSRSEALIAYSNHAFYDARLSTVPDRMFDGVLSDLDDGRELEANSAEDARRHLQATLTRPISVHKLEHGVYADRRNEGEADYVAELVRSLLLNRDPNDSEPLSIGVVAFSEAQQGNIEDSLEELALLDPEFRVLLESERVREDDGEFAGLFVKNLENVQGDERDLIIMSVCYAPGLNGKMRMNFGPINQAGGERRLNVIFSRAKQHMAIVTSIVGAQITNTHNDGAANLAKFLDYAQAESSGQERISASLLESLRPPGAGRHRSEIESRGPSSAATHLAERLRTAGLEVDTCVGRSGFQIDVAVRGGRGYILGILIDPTSQAAPHDESTSVADASCDTCRGDVATPESGATNRFVAEAGVLKSFGWPVHRVLLQELVDQPDTVVERILTVIAQLAA